jgi:hypothetical protein
VVTADRGRERVQTGVERKATAVRVDEAFPYRALDESGEESGRQHSGEREQGARESRHAAGGRPEGSAVDEREVRDAVGGVSGDDLRDTPAEAMPHETGSRDPKVVHQSEDRRGVVGAVGGAGAGIRSAEPREVAHDEAMACGEIPDNALPEAGGGGEPMQEDDGYTLPAGAGGEIVHALPTDIHELASHAW